MGKNSAICNQAVNEVYRTALIKHVCRFLKAEFPTNWNVRVADVLGSTKWELIVNRRRDIKHAQFIQDINKSEYELFTLEELNEIIISFIDQLLPLSELTTSDRKRKRQSLLHWAKIVCSPWISSDELQNEEIPFEDAFIAINAARRVLELLGESESVVLSDFATKLSGGPVFLREPLENTLPPREMVVVDFVGRSGELDNLWEWFRDPYSRRWALAGAGGKGKSAVAYEFGTQVCVSAPPPFQIVFWLSAKKRRFEEGKPVATGPDFSDLSTALDKILSGYGWRDELGADQQVRKEKVLALFNEYPALVIVDDVDSLETKNEDAIEFMTLTAPNTRSKVLLTSRRQLFGMGHSTTDIGGLSHEDLVKFISSRCRMFGLDGGLMNNVRFQEIQRITEGSPLYVEDLLRLAAAVTLDQAIKSWAEKAGDEARRYALEREFGLLTRDSKDTLLAACLRPGAVSFAELESITGFRKTRLAESIEALQRLFLVPKPRLIEGEERFEVNLNTRSMVVKISRATDRLRRMEAAVRAVTDQLPYSDDAGSSPAIRQAIFLVKTKEYTKAEETLRTELELRPNDPDLIAALGWVYKNATRFVDARQEFMRAGQLKCRKIDCYRHWIALETSEGEWTSAAKAAELGLKYLPGNREFTYWAGYCHSRLGKELLSGFVLEKARAELQIASDFLNKSLKSPEKLWDSRQRQLNALAYRAILLNYEAQADLLRLELGIPRRSPAAISRFDQGALEREAYKRFQELATLISRYLQSWVSEHPDDLNAFQEKSRLEAKFGINTQMTMP